MLNLTHMRAGVGAAPGEHPSIKHRGATLLYRHRRWRAPTPTLPREERERGKEDRRDDTGIPADTMDQVVRSLNLFRCG